VTERHYYTDCYLTEFESQTASVAEEGRLVYLARTAFYPASGGQLFDTGELGGARVEEVVEEGDRIAHRLDRPVSEGVLRGRVDWPRRFDFMQQHTGQHLLSAVLHHLEGVETVSVHMGEEVSTVELQVDALDEGVLVRAETRANEVIWENREVTIGFSQAAEAGGLRKTSAREGTLRIVSIAGLDKSACGGTHVRRTGEIGCLFLGRQERIRGNVRLEFFCGGRAVRLARRDFDALSSIGRLLSRGPAEAAAGVAALQESAKELGKENRRLTAEAAGLRGKELYSTARVDDSGLRRFWLQAESLDELVRATAQAFTSAGRGAFLATAKDAILLAASADSGLHCGNLLRELLVSGGGRGGGSAQLAQGSVRDVSSIAGIAASLGFVH
jgi:alanyl-tRNA synthetase